MKIMDVTCSRCSRPGLYWDTEQGAVVHAEKADGTPLVGCIVQLPESDPHPVISEPCTEHLSCIAYRRGLL